MLHGFRSRLIRSLVATLGLATLLACGARTPPPAGPPPAVLRSIEATLEQLYASFCFEAGGEPDWATMRSLFAQGAGFVAPVQPDRPFRAVDADTFVREFRAWLETSPEGQSGLYERIVDTRIEVFATIAHAWVVFESFVPGRPEIATSRGLDSIQLIRTGERWLVASFTTQYANDELPVPGRFDR